jgi:hypothetical protein
MRAIKSLGIALFGIVIACVAYAQFTPAPPDIHINGHTYTAAQWQANPLGTLAAIANDVNAITQLYPTGRFSPRVTLLADLAMYVDTNGSDSNNCLIGFPCQTPQHAYNVLRDKYDLAGYKVTVNLACGTYTGGLFDTFQLLGQTLVTQLEFTGCNAGNPTQTVINGVETGAESVVQASYTGAFYVTNMKIQAAVGPHGLGAVRGGKLNFNNVNFGSVPGCQVWGNQHGEIHNRGNYAISGGAGEHMCSQASSINEACSSGTTCTVTLSNTPAFTYFSYAVDVGLLYAPSMTFSGTGATGMRYYADSNGVIDTFGGGASYFPGNAAGCSGIACTTGGQYK